MKRTVWMWELFGFAFTSFCGTLLHFAYDWLDKSVLIAAFSGVNESTFEHMKLLFWPMLIYTAFQSFFFRRYQSFACVKLKSTLLGLGLIPVLFYTYNGVIGKSPDWINIAIFFISAAVVYIYETRALTDGSARCKNPKLATALLVFIGALFVIFTFNAPEIELFRDPLTSAYGI
jgi:hypothetical protein